MQVDRAGSATTAAQIATVLRHSIDHKASLQSRGEAIADQTALPNLALGGFTLLVMGPSSALAVLLASFGYNMRLISPISVINYLKRGADNNILIKDGRALEQLRRVDRVVFDKTGTLTLEEPQVRQVICYGQMDEAHLLALAAAAEMKQSHPIARAIVNAARERNLSIPKATESAIHLGNGLTVWVENQRVTVGSSRYVQSQGIDLPGSMEQMAQTHREQGDTLVFVVVDAALAGVLVLRVTARPEAEGVVRYLQERGIEVYMISGDHEAPARKLAHSLGMDGYFAETLPVDKGRLVEQFREEGKTVCFVGDGINDAIALQKADVSVSLSGAATIAQDAAQIVLIDGDLARLPQVFELANSLDRNMRLNLATTLIPGFVCIYGVFFWHMGVVAAELLYNAGLVAGIINAMAPALQRGEGKYLESPPEFPKISKLNSQ